jgi:hypothetical protein
MEPHDFAVVLNECRHEFCVRCIRQWSLFGAAVMRTPDGPCVLAPQPACPLCKQAFSFTRPLLRNGIEDRVQFATLRTAKAPAALPCPHCKRQVAIIRYFAHILDCVPVPCPACSEPFVSWEAHVQRCDKLPA